MLRPASRKSSQTGTARFRIRAKQPERWDAVLLRLDALDPTFIVLCRPITKPSHTVPAVTEKLWRPPFRIDIANVIRRGRNTIAIDASYLWVNRLIGYAQVRWLVEQSSE